MRPQLSNRIQLVLLGLLAVSSVVNAAVPVEMREAYREAAAREAASGRANGGVVSSPSTSGGANSCVGSDGKLSEATKRTMVALKEKIYCGPSFSWAECRAVLDFQPNRPQGAGSSPNLRELEVRVLRAEMLKTYRPPAPRTQSPSRSAPSRSLNQTQVPAVATIWWLSTAWANRDWPGEFDIRPRSPWESPEIQQRIAQVSQFFTDRARSLERESGELETRERGILQQAQSLETQERGILQQAQALDTQERGILQEAQALESRGSPTRQVIELRQQAKELRPQAAELRQQARELSQQASKLKLDADEVLRQREAVGARLLQINRDLHGIFPEHSERPDRWLAKVERSIRNFEGSNERNVAARGAITNLFNQGANSITARQAQALMNTDQAPRSALVRETISKIARGSPIGFITLGASSVMAGGIDQALTEVSNSSVTGCSDIVNPRTRSWMLMNGNCIPQVSLKDAEFRAFLFRSEQEQAEELRERKACAAFQRIVNQERPNPATFRVTCAKDAAVANVTLSTPGVNTSRRTYSLGWNQSAQLPDRVDATGSALGLSLVIAADGSQRVTLDPRRVTQPVPEVERERWRAADREMELDLDHGRSFAMRAAQCCSRGHSGGDKDATCTNEVHSVWGSRPSAGFEPVVPSSRRNPRQSPTAH